MKKTFIFASFVAVIALLATSCQPKGEAPKALFDYEISGMEVTFINLSKNAESYAWDFGDGSAISNEANPVHTYAENGTFTVTLKAKNKAGENTYEDVIPLEKQAVEIVVDGKFDDWAAVPEKFLAKAEADDDAAMEDLYAIKFCTDQNYIYYYAEFNGAEGVVQFLDFMMDLDDNPSTGYAIWFWTYNDGTAGAECMVLGDLLEGFENAAIYKFAEGAPQDVWDGNWDDTEAAGAIKASEIVDLGGGHKAIEGSIMRAMLPNPNPTVLHIGAYVSDPNWAEVGALPEQKIDGEGVTTCQPMLNVPLN